MELPCCLQALPIELALECARHVIDLRDRARLCLALPPLGVTAMRELAEYTRSLLFIIAMRLAMGSTIDEDLLREYARSRAADRAGCELLSEWSCGAVGLRVVDTAGRSYWHLTPGGVEGAKVRKVYIDAGIVIHFEGDVGVERMVRRDDARGYMLYLEGEKGVERAVRQDCPDGRVKHLEGERHAERMVRVVMPNGDVFYYEGERYNERKIREVRQDGHVVCFEGEKGAERVAFLASWPTEAATAVAATAVPLHRERASAHCSLAALHALPPRLL